MAMGLSYLAGGGNKAFGNGTEPWFSIPSTRNILRVKNIDRFLVDVYEFNVFFPYEKKEKKDKGKKRLFSTCKPEITRVFKQLLN